MNTAIATRCVSIPWNIKTLGPNKIKAIKVDETVYTDSGGICWLILKYYLRVNCYNFSASAPDHQDSFQSLCQHLQELHVWGVGRVRFKDIHKIFPNISNISFVSTSKNSMSKEIMVVDTFSMRISCAASSSILWIFWRVAMWKFCERTLNWNLFNCQSVLTFYDICSNMNMMMQQIITGLTFWDQKLSNLFQPNQYWQWWGGMMMMMMMMMLLMSYMSSLCQPRPLLGARAG